MREPPPLKRTTSTDSQRSHASAATSASRASSKLLFGEIPLTPATTVDGRSTRSNSLVCSLVMSTSSAFLRFWLNDVCRDNLLAHLDHDDTPSFRLVCHDFATRAAPVLFDSLTATFRPSTFSKPARLDALARIGRHVKTFTFHMPHGPDTFLPPLVDPETGEERQFLYEPQLQTPPHAPGRDKPPKYGSAEMTNLLIQQYPPLFHAATNVPAFVAAFSELVNLTHLKVSCPGHARAPRHRRSAVDYALISLRIAVERAPLYSLHALSLHPIHPGGLLYLHPMHGFGSTPSSAKRWGQIRSLSICMESVCPSPAPSTPKARLQSLEHLRTLHAYLGTLSRSLTRLFFRWKGARGPSPLSLDKEPCMQPTAEETMHPSQRHPPSARSSGPRALKFPRLRHMELENAEMDSTQIAAFIRRHARSLAEFNFEDVKLRRGSWDDALAPLTRIAGSDRWKRCQEEVMDVPIVLRPAVGSGGVEPRVMGPLLEEVDAAIEEVVGAGGGGGRCRERTGSRALSRWLHGGKPRGALRKTPVALANANAHPHDHLAQEPAAGKESFWGGGGDHVKRLLRFSTWK